nr:MAG TPA: hypothetical protein [Bacteriophage sp.]
MRTSLKKFYLLWSCFLDLVTVLYTNQCTLSIRIIYNNSRFRLLCFIHFVHDIVNFHNFKYTISCTFTIVLVHVFVYYNFNKSNAY